MTTTAPPRFSLVSAVYGVARFLEDYISSIETQTFSLERVQVVLVDDGSVDGSLDLAQAWADRRPDLVTLVKQENAGQAAARNTGLQHATGEWVTFVDPDDTVSQGYLESVDRFIVEHPEVDLVATNRWIWNDGTGEITNTHPLRQMFQHDRLVDLVADGQHFQGSAPAAFFRRDRVADLELRFDSRIQPAFEDAHFTIRYLLECARPMVGFLQSAQYHYRKRADGTSTLQMSRAHPGRYAEMLELGYLDVVGHALRRHGHLPSWLQAHLVFDLSWYFTLTDSHARAGTPTQGEPAERMHASVREILSHVDVDHYVPRSIAPIGRLPRYVLQHGYAEQAWHEPYVAFTRLDPVQHLVLAEYFFTGSQPSEQVLVEGVPVAPLHAKTVEHRYGGRVLLSRRILWIPSNRRTAVNLDGQAMDVVFRRPPFPTTLATPHAVRWNLGELGGWARREGKGFVEPAPTSRRGRIARRLHYRARATSRYGAAWVLMDRVDAAEDSAEALFKHLRAQHPSVNAWFVLAKGTPSWKRLSSAGYADRMVAHGSISWRLLMANAEHLISSHGDDEITDPPAILEFVRPRWKFAYLGHGVVEDDVSAWLNGKRVETLVTSTSRQFTAIAGDSSYALSTREVQCTGLPRFDPLHQAAERLPAAQRDLLLVAPTWGPESLREWRAFLDEDKLRAAADQHGLTLALLVHRDSPPVPGDLELPAWVEQLSPDGADTHELLARTRLFVTDYSPLVFDVAYLQRPVVYLQPDRDPLDPQVDDADPGRDRFGPVTASAPEAVSAVLAALDHGPEPMEPYDSRIRAAFPRRDAQCSERVVQALLLSVKDRSQEPPAPTPAQASGAPDQLAAARRGMEP